MRGGFGVCTGVGILAECFSVVLCRDFCDLGFFDLPRLVGSGYSRSNSATMAM